MEGSGAQTKAESGVSIARAVVYRHLASSFSFPEMELIDLFEGDSLAECLAGWHAFGINASKEVTEITAWLRSAGSETALSEMQVEYTRLFVNAYPSIPVPPYSSVYLDKDRLVWGPSTAHAVRLYEAAGLYLSTDFAEIPDHIAVEMEFASYLIVGQQRDQSVNGDSTKDLPAVEVEFLAEHLFKWAPGFFNRTAECSTMIFYQVMAKLAHRFIEWDVKHLTKGA